MARGGEMPADCARGALVGAALGDALGAAFEGAPTVSPTQVQAVVRARTPLRWTDDTAMMIALAEHLIDTGGLAEDTLVQRFAAAWEAEPDRGYGGGPPRIFTQMRRGVPWQQAAASLYGGGSFGNGGAMRVAPVALLHDDPSVVADLARRSASVTHAHPLGREGAAVQAVAVQSALRSAGSRIETVPFLRAVEDQAGQLTGTLQPIPALVAEHATPKQVAARLGNSVSVAESVPAALAAFLIHPDSPLDAIEFAICCGGDADTIAAMAGALAGARCGASALPIPLVERLEAASRIAELADALTR